MPQAPQVLDVDEWLRMMAYQQLVTRCGRLLHGHEHPQFPPLCAARRSKVALSAVGLGLGFPGVGIRADLRRGEYRQVARHAGNRRAYLNHMCDILTTTFNTAYMTRWTNHYGAVAGQDVSTILTYINSRSAFVLNQLPTTTAFSITNSNGNNFTISNSTVSISGTAPVQVKTIEVNGVVYRSRGRARRGGRSRSPCMAARICSSFRALTITAIDEPTRRIRSPSRIPGRPRSNR